MENRKGIERTRGRVIEGERKTEKVNRKKSRNENLRQSNFPRAAAKDDGRRRKQVTQGANKDRQKRANREND